MPLMSSMALAAHLASPVMTAWPPQIEQWRTLIEPIARSHGLDPALIASIVQHESNGNPDAYRSEPLLGVESIGLMQVVTFDWRNLDQRDLFDPAYNLRYGTRLLAQILRANEFELRLSLAMYNCGAEGVRLGACGRWGGYRYADSVIRLCAEFGGCIPLPPFMERRR